MLGAIIIFSFQIGNFSLNRRNLASVFFNIFIYFIHLSLRKSFPLGEITHYIIILMDIEFLMLWLLWRTRLCNPTTTTRDSSDPIGLRPPSSGGAFLIPFGLREGERRGTGRHKGKEEKRRKVKEEKWKIRKGRKIVASILRIILPGNCGHSIIIIF